MWSQSVQLKNHKKITIRQGNICTTEEVFDLLFCSAFKRDYLPVEGTLIGNLMIQKGISVEQLAEKPRLDFRDGRDCWVSEPVKGNIRRVACIELLDYEKREDAAMMQSVILKNMFSSVCFLLEQANREGLTLRRVALPILGAGNQGLEICYVIPPLLAQCMQALHTIPQLEEIVFYEMDENKAHKLYEGLTRALDRSHAGEDVFISYSSAQRTLADALRSYLEKHGISCWMAPYSIPSGSSYQAEIPAALNRTAAVVLLLSEDSEKSRWVQKEVGSTIGARHCLIPYMDHPYEHTRQFNFLLDGEQIFEAWAIDDEAARYEALLDELAQKLDKDIMAEDDGSAGKKAETQPKESVLQELKSLNRILRIGFASLFALKVLELAIHLSRDREKR